MKRKTPWCWNWPVSAANPHGYSLLGGAGRVVFGAVLLLLTACAGAPPVVQEVKIPVLTPCIKAVPARPAFAFPMLPATASEGEKVLAMARDTLLHFRYEGQLEAVVAGCL